MTRATVALTVAALALMAVSLVVGVHKADAHYRPGTHNAVHAIQLAWCGRSSVSCWQSREAVAVARCESNLWQYAQNGDYLGLFQQGAYSRSTYGFGWDPWSQAFAARRMQRAEGWWPWPVCGAPYR